MDCKLAQQKDGSNDFQPINWQSFLSIHSIHHLHFVDD